MSLMSHQAAAGDETFALSGIDALLATAVRSSPHTVLVADDAEAVSAAVLSRRAGVLAERFRLAGLRRGERVLIVAATQVATLVALFAALRAGLEPALARPGLSAVDLAAHAKAAEAVGVVGPSWFGGSMGDIYLSAAAVADSVRMIATHGSEVVDGALDVSARTLDASRDSPAATAMPPLEMPLIGTFAGPIGEPRFVSHRQAALFADALSLVEQARINPSRRLLSLMMPSSRAGLVAGPFAALVGASALAMHGPFDSRTFRAQLAADPTPHLVAPASLGPLLVASGTIDGLSSLILVSRHADTERFEAPEAMAAPCPVVDLYAFGEDTVLAQHRLDSEARAPTRVADRSLSDGLGARLNKARAEHRLHAGDGG